MLEAVLSAGGEVVDARGAGGAAAGEGRGELRALARRQAESDPATLCDPPCNPM